MTSKRMIPTWIFDEPDVMTLSSNDTRLLLIWLLLFADDEGRGFAHTSFLGRRMGFPPEDFESALQELEKHDLLVLYQVGRHRYYQLTRWHNWQIPQGRRTPSKHPAPPQRENGSSFAADVCCERAEREE